MQNKQTHDYLRFSQYLLPIIYAILVIIIKTMKTRFINVVISVLKKNILKKRRRIHRVKSTITASLGVLTAGTNTKISQNKNYFLCLKIFGGFQ